MCGIAGFVGQGNKNIIEKMTTTLAHRGPDASGFFVKNNVFLGHRRLSIIDLQTGDQPMFNEDKSIVVIFNGEIYNFQKLKKELSRHTFKTNSDTEVIVRGYEEWGEQLFERLEGMFAIAIWDDKNKKLILARDRFGEKPLYWFRNSNNLVFASELKSLIMHPSFKKEIDFSSLSKYFFFEYIPSPHTIFENVYKIEPGSFLTLQNNKIKIKKYWQIEFGNPKKAQKTQKELSKELEECLNKSTKERLISDVPLGVFLSGGIDSSAIAYFAQKNSPKPIKTFSIGFEEKSFDESNWARLVSKRLGTEHYEKIFSQKEMLNLIPKIFENLDEPLADASILPTYLLSEMTKEKVTVALGGDGGDEFWMGYDPFVAHKFFPLFGVFPKSIKNLFKPLASLIPVSHKNMSLDFKVNKFLNGINTKDEVLRNQMWMSAFTPEEINELFRPDVYKNNREKIIEDTKKVARENPGKSKWQRLIYAYSKHYLSEDILVKVDRASMMNSLEVRSPFLNSGLVSFINNLPDNLKFRKLTSKYLLKKLMTKYLGKDIVYRKKKGFGIPVAEWLSGSLREELEELLSEKRIKEQGIFNYLYVKKILEEHLSKKKNHRQKLWSLFVFQKWYDNWM